MGTRISVIHPNDTNALQDIKGGDQRARTEGDTMIEGQLVEFLAIATLLYIIVMLIR
jgi:hypothetical protein